LEPLFLNVEAYYAAVCGLSLKEMNKLEVTQPQRLPHESLYIVGCASFDPQKNIRIWLIDVLGNWKSKVSIFGTGNFN